MLTKGTERGMRRWRAVALLATGAVIGVVMVATPAGAHVGGTVEHLWNDHIRPKADARYAKKTLPPGKLLTGNYAAWGYGGGYMGDNIQFRTPLARDLGATEVHFIAGAAFTAECPGYGDALAGHLCVYERQQGNRTIGGIFDSEGGVGGGASRNGFWVYYETSTAAGSWSYGEWAVRGPTATISAANARSGESPAPPND